MRKSDVLPRISVNPLPDDRPVPYFTLTIIILYVLSIYIKTKMVNIKNIYKKKIM